MAYQQQHDVTLQAVPSAKNAGQTGFQTRPSTEFQNFQFKSELSVVHVLGHVILWIILSVVTLGFGLFVFPYYMQKFILNQTYAYDADGKKTGRLKCTIDLASIIGNIILWVLISIVTLGIGYIVFLYKINAHCLSHTKLVSVNAI